MLFAVAEIVRLFDETFKTGEDASWVIVMIWLETPVPETVIVADRVTAKGFSDAVNVIVAFPEPLELLGVNHV